MSAVLPGILKKILQQIIPSLIMFPLTPDEYTDKRESQRLSFPIATEKYILLFAKWQEKK